MKGINGLSYIEYTTEITQRKCHILLVRSEKKGPYIIMYLT